MKTVSQKTLQYSGHKSPKSVQSQLGLGFIGFLLLAALAVGIGALGMKLFPVVMENITIEKTVKRIVKEAPTASLQEWRASFDRFAQIDAITSISGKDLQLEKGMLGPVLQYAYDKKIPLFGPASLLLEFKGNATGK